MGTAFAGKTSIPKKLKQDAIAEALLEYRFDSGEIGEIVIGRLTDKVKSQIKDASVTRLPTAQVPEVIREQDPALKHHPVIEIRDSSNNFSVRIGAHVISYHVYVPYPGWGNVRNELERITGELFESLSEVTINRIGLRYINLIQTTKHGVKALANLAFGINIGDNSHPLTDDLNFGFRKTVTDDHIVLTRVASTEFVEGAKLPDDTVAVIDVDVYTPLDFVCNKYDAALAWVDAAHDIEKVYFFNLLPDELIVELAEE